MERAFPAMANGKSPASLSGDASMVFTKRMKELLLRDLAPATGKLALFNELVGEAG